MATKLHGKSTKAYDDIDIDALLGTLTEEELEQLGMELIDPDDSCIPPSDRCAYKTNKTDTGPLDRKKLLEFLETKALNEKDWEEVRAFKKETRGKVYEQKAEARTQVADDIDMDTEWDEVLANATEEELVDLAAILGFHGMMNQSQYHQAFVSKEDILGHEGGFHGVAKHQDFKLFEDEPPNSTDVEACLGKIKSNDPELKDLNLNNIKNISEERLIEFANALKENTNLDILQMCNTRATEKVARAIAASLKDNKTLKTLSLESNYISGKGIVALLEAININQTLTEFRIANQRPKTLGCQIEMKIAQLVKDNETMLKFGIFLDVMTSRVAVSEHIQGNNDGVRRVRVGDGDSYQAEKDKRAEQKAERDAKNKVHEKKAAEAKQERESGAAKKVEEEKKKKEESEEEESSEEESEEESGEEEE